MRSVPGSAHPHHHHQTPHHHQPQHQQQHQLRVVPQVQQLPPSTGFRPHVVVNSKGELSSAPPATPSMTPLVLNNPAPNKSALSAQLAKSGEMTSEQRVEHFSKIWIRQNCRADAQASVDRGEFYAAYVQYFRNTHKILSCSLQNFCKFVK